MSLVSKQIPNLINGISQQPAELRLESQGEIQENGLSDVVDGLKKRPPTKFIKKFVKTKTSYTTGVLTTDNTESLDVSDCYITTYKRSETEQYTVVIKPHATTPIIYVYDINGNLNYESGAGSWDWSSGSCVFAQINTDDTSYLAAVDGVTLTKNDITSTSVSDYTFIVNKKKIILQDDDIEPLQTGSKALIYLKSTNYSRNYNLTITSKTDTSEQITSSTTTGNGDANNTSDQTDLRVGAVVTALRTGIRTHANAVSSGSYGNPEQVFPSSPYISNYSLNYIRFNDTAPNSVTRYNEYGSVTTGISTKANNGQIINIIHPTGEFDVADNILLVVGGVVIPYAGTSEQTRINGYSATDYVSGIDESTGTITTSKFPKNGWVFNPFCKTTTNGRGAILLPSGAISTIKAGASYRGYTTVYDSSAANYNIIVEPHYASGISNLPYFVVTCPDEGQIKDFNIEATDDDGGTNLRVFKDTAKSFTDLPNHCIEGYTIQVAGDNNKKEDNFYVAYQGSGGTGTWKETVAPNLKNKFVANTLPHTLKQKVNASGNLYFCFTQGSDYNDKSWFNRPAGDDTTNPFPSFTNNTISDIFFHRSRLGIISGENVIFSETNNFFNFFRTTVRTLLDTDPIDVAVSQNEVSELKAALPIQDSLLLFSEINQFTLSATQLLTPAEVTIDQSTKFECDLTASPVGAGNSVFFAQKGGNYSNVREYFTDGNTEIKDAALVTSHCPEYLKGRITNMVASTNENMLVCQTDDDKKCIYIYKYFDQNNERLQSSWSKWKFDQDVASMSFNNSKVYIVFTNGSFEELSLRTDAADVSYGNAFQATFNPSLLGGTNYSSLTPSQASGLGFSNNIGTYAAVGYVNTHIGIIFINPKSNAAMPSGTANGLTSDVNFEFLRMPNLSSVVVNGTTFSVTDTSNFHIVKTGNLLEDGDGYTKYFFRFKTDSARITFFEGLSGAANIVFNYSEGVAFNAKSHDILLDHRIKVDGSTIQSVSNLETAVPFMDDNTEYIGYNGEVIGTGQSADTKAAVVAHMYAGSTVQTHTENNSTVNTYVHIGQPYTFKYGVSEQVFKPRGNDPTSIARFQLRNMTFNFNDTASFKVTQTSTQRLPVETTYAGRTVGSLTSFIGFTSVVPSDSYTIPIQSQAKEVDITISNDTHLPCIFQSAEWEGYVVLRNQRL